MILLVDAFEGAMPQTRFVLSKALDLKLKPIVVVNKVDKENCKPDEVNEQVFELMYSLDASEDQLDFHTIFGSSKHGWMSNDWKEPTTDITPLLDKIIEIIPPAPVKKGALKMQITSLDFSPFTGRLAIGRVFPGTIKENMQVGISKRDGSIKRVKVKELHIFEGLGKNKTPGVQCGDICAITGIEDFEIGDTITDFDNPEVIERIAIDEPTMSMMFSINDSPFFGKEGKFVTSRHLRERLMKEMEKNLALKVEETETEDKFLVFGRGVLHLSVLIETMRREGYEFQIGQPQVIFKEKDGVKMEPIEHLVVDVPETFSGKVIELATQKKRRTQCNGAKRKYSTLRV